MTDWSLIGGNPAPGDVGVLEAASGSVDQVREEASDYLQQIQGILDGWSGSGWSGSAAARFEQLLQGAARHLSQMETAHEPVGKALAAHAATLSEQQPTANSALQKAEQAQAQKATASARRTAAKAQYAQATQAHAAATSDLAQIETSISALGADVIGALQHLLGKKQTAETRQSAAQEEMQVASGIIGKMEGWISEAESALSGAVKLADQVRSDVESSAKHALGLITDVDDDLHNFWHHVAQDAASDAKETVRGLEGTFDHFAVSVGRDLDAIELTGLEALARGSHDSATFIQHLPAWADEAVDATLALVLTALGFPEVGELAEKMGTAAAEVLFALTTLLAEVALVLQGTRRVTRGELEQDVEQVETGIEQAGVSEIPGTSGTMVSDISSLPPVEDALNDINRDAAQLVVQ